MINKKFKGVIQIFRPELPLAAGICVVLGEVIALGGLPSFQEMVLGFLSGFFISGSAIVLNDYFDLEVDKVNTPNRPLPSGVISPTEAIVLAGITSAIGLISAFAIGVSAFLLCVIFWGIGFLYNWRFKETGLPGNLIVAVNVGVTFILGGMSVGDPWNKIVWCFALMAFLIDLGEEIAGDAMDSEGDKKRGSRSIAIVHGRLFALHVSSLLFGLVVPISLLPVIFDWMGTIYLVLIAITDLWIVTFVVRLWKSKTPQEGRTSMRGIYLGATFGVLASILGQVLQ
jgi:geranylgeranylglycerol-phosphate geranylgeranyltransferase